MRAVGEVARQQGVAEPGYRLLVRVGTGGGQEIPHLHVHVLAGKPVEK
jgi:diadenosine tetraphosphate (Ap4A) HIT family hydrolase